jgi:regulator of protease activity HflC (stomatin/prohibitin superfamily)
MGHPAFQGDGFEPGLPRGFPDDAGIATFPMFDDFGRSFERAEINREVMDALREREDQYGIEFTLVQIQSASPPTEVVSAIKDRMVVVEKQADGEANQIIKLAEAQAMQIALTSQAKQEAVGAMLDELDGRGDLAGQYIQVLLAQELQPNSKWIINGGDATPVIELRETP